jgi:TrkA domain protein
MDVKEVLLPGVGLRFEFENHDGDRIGVAGPQAGHFSATRDPAPRSGRRIVRGRGRGGPVPARFTGTGGKPVPAR